MKLAPRMIQSMEILQLPVMALNDRIEAGAAGKRGAGERRSKKRPTRKRPKSPGRGARRPKKPSKSASWSSTPDHNNEADFERLLEMSADWPEDNLAAGSRPSSNRIEEEGERKLDAMSNMEARPQSLHD